MADFASLMGAAISKKKPPASAATQSSESAANGASKNGESKKKFVRRGDLEAEREAAYRAEQAAAAAAKDERLEAKRKREEEESEREAIREEKRRRLAEESKAIREQQEFEEEEKRRKRVGLPSLAEKRAAAEKDGKTLVLDELQDIDEDELRQKLRELEEPAILFAESHAGRLKRYRALTEPKAVLSKTPIPTTLALLPESEMHVEVTKPPRANSPERAYLLRQLASYFTMILTEWIRALNGRDAEVKTSSQGRAAAAAMEQSRENLRPLFKKFERGDIEDGVLEPVIEIVRAAQRRRYVDANDAYLTLSIGKAAWPIGVTMVGIHERS